MILDKTRSRHAIARRVLVLALVPVTAALVTLAILRPDARAQPASVSLSGNADNPVVTLPNGVTVRMAGITDTQRRMPWWSLSGLPAVGVLPDNTLVYPSLPVGIRGRAFAIAETYTLASQPEAVWNAAPQEAEEYQQVRPGVYARRPGETWQFEPDDHKYRLDHIQHERPQGQAEVTQVNVVPCAFDARQQHCRVRYAVAAGPWTQSVKCPKTAGKTTIRTAFGPVIFTLFTNPHHLPTAQAAQGNAIFMVTDRFHYPSWLKADNSSQATLRDGESCERVVYALDTEGRIVTELNGLLGPGIIDASGNFKYEQLISIPNSALKNVAMFQLVARPYQWAEFTDVALKPVQKAAIVPTITPMKWQTSWTSSDVHSTWNPKTPTYHMQLHVSPAMSGTRPDPPVTGELVAGPGQASHFAIAAWKPGKSNILSAKFDYTPNQADKVHPDVIHLLTKTGTVAAIIRYNAD